MREGVDFAVPRSTRTQSTEPVETVRTPGSQRSDTGDTTMRYLSIYTPNADLTKRNEAGVPPSPEELAAMGKFMEESIKAGVFLSGEGCKPSSKGARVRLADGKVTVTDGPFTESKELVAGFA